MKIKGLLKALLFIGISFIGIITIYNVFILFRQNDIRITTPFERDQFIASIFSLFGNADVVVEETGDSTQSTNAAFWVNSGGRVTINGEIASSMQGDALENDYWRSNYSASNPVGTDNGLHPQNILRIVSQDVWKNVSQEMFFRINKINISDSPNRNQSNGVLFMSRYIDGDNLYYAGVRVDGEVVVKKKKNGVYYTLGQATIINGEYDKTIQPSLLPINAWQGLKTEVFNELDNTVTIRVYYDSTGIGTWTKVLEVKDDGVAFGGEPILSSERVGIRTDFMDVEFRGYQIEDIPEVKLVALDAEAPDITLNGYAEDAILQGKAFVDPGVLVVDNIDSNPAVSIFGSPVNDSLPGTYTIKYIAQDSAGNISSTTRTIYIVENITPSFPQNKELSCEQMLEQSQFYLNNQMQSVRHINEMRAARRTVDVEILASIGCVPQGIWVSSKISNIKNFVGKILSAANDKLPIFIIYNIPNTQSYIWGSGISRGDQYTQWVVDFAKGIGEKVAWIIIEPDLIGLSFKYSSQDSALARADIKNTIDVLRKSAPNVKIFLDAGHSNWRKPVDVALALKESGIDKADGFATNISNFRFTASEIQYGRLISALTNGKPFIIDTGRNGSGPTLTSEWCNPVGRAIGHFPSLDTGVSGVLGYVWIKNPGESDGTCNGGPTPGIFWEEYAIDLVKNARALTDNLLAQGIVFAVETITSPPSLSSTTVSITTNITEEATKEKKTNKLSSIATTVLDMVKESLIDVVPPVFVENSNNNSIGNSGGSSSGGGGGGSSNSGGGGISSPLQPLPVSITENYSKDNKNQNSSSVILSESGMIQKNNTEETSVNIGVNQAQAVNSRLSTNSSSNSPAEFISGKFSIGMSNERVKILQSMLSKDAEIYPERKITGYYGPVTTRAVQRFQKKYGLVEYGSPDTTGFGLAGPKTREKLNEVFGNVTIVKPEFSAESDPVKPSYMTLKQKEIFIKTIKDKIEELTKKVTELMELVKISSSNR